MKKGCSIKLWKRCLIFLLVLCMMNLSWIPEMDCTGVQGTQIQLGAIQAQAAEVYQHFYFQGGLFMPPKTALSYPWTYMKKGDKVQFAVTGNGTLYVGITRKSTKVMYGVKRSNNFTVTLTVPASDYYRVFIINNSTRAVSFRGAAVCSR